MVERAGWALRWASGPGRQSGLLALNAVAVAAVPFLYGLRPCTDAACTVVWDRLFFVPNLLFIPAIAASLWLWGSWRAQRGHARLQRRYFADLEAREVPDLPPGHVRPPHLSGTWPAGRFATPPSVPWSLPSSWGCSGTGTASGCAAATRWTSPGTPASPDACRPGAGWMPSWRSRCGRSWA